MSWWWMSFMECFGIYIKILEQKFVTNENLFLDRFTKRAIFQIWETSVIVYYNAEKHFRENIFVGFQF